MAVTEDCGGWVAVDAEPGARRVADLWVHPPTVRPRRIVPLRVLLPLRIALAAMLGLLGVRICEAASASSISQRAPAFRCGPRIPFIGATIA